MMKTISFEGVTYDVPSTMCYVARDKDGAIHAYEREPIRGDLQYYCMGGTHTILREGCPTSWVTSCVRCRL